MGTAWDYEDFRDTHLEAYVYSTERFMQELGEAGDE
jgi:hypothetical protein